MMRSKAILSFLLALSSTYLVALPYASAAGQRWNAYTYNPTSEIIAGQGMQRLAKTITKESGGKLVVRLHFGGSLPIKATNITQAVSEGGTIQLVDDGFPYGNIPIAGVLNMPLLLTDAHEFAMAEKIMLPYIDKAFSKKGIVILGIYHYPLQTSWSSKKLMSLADLAGMKMRVSSPQQAAYVREFGGTPVTLGSPEVAPALQRGVVQGVFTASVGGGIIWKDLLKYNYRLGPNYFASYITANKLAFDRLDPKTQKIVRTAATSVATWDTNTMAENELKVTKELQSGGMIVSEAKPSDIKNGAKRMAAYWKQWAEKQGPLAVKALNEVRAAIHK